MRFSLSYRTHYGAPPPWSRVSHVSSSVWKEPDILFKEYDVSTCGVVWGFLKVYIRFSVPLREFSMSRCQEPVFGCSFPLAPARRPRDQLPGPRPRRPAPTLARAPGPRARRARRPSALRLPHQLRSCSPSRALNRCDDSSRGLDAKELYAC